MQAVILVGGKGTRMRPLTNYRPKPLVLCAGKPLLQHTFEALPKEIEEVILVIGYRGAQIKKHFGTDYNHFKIRYVLQKEQRGTYHALKQAKRYLKNKFIVLMGDDIYSKPDLAKLTKHKHAVLVRKVTGPSEQYGACILKGNSLLKNICEKQKGVQFTYANCGAYTLTPAIFKEKIIYGPTGEEYLSSMIGTLAKKYPTKVVEASFWFPVATPADIKSAENLLKEKRSR